MSDLDKTTEQLTNAAFHAFRLFQASAEIADIGHELWLNEGFPEDWRANNEEAACYSHYKRARVKLLEHLINRYSPFYAELIEALFDLCLKYRPDAITADFAKHYRIAFTKDMAKVSYLFGEDSAI